MSPSRDDVGVIVRAIVLDAEDVGGLACVGACMLVTDARTGVSEADVEGVDADGGVVNRTGQDALPVGWQEPGT